MSTYRHLSPNRTAWRWRSAAWIGLLTLLVSLLPAASALAQVPGPPQASIEATGAADLAEGNGIVSEFTFDISLDRAPENEVTVHYATVDGSATTADGDYVGVTDGIVTFPALTTTLTQPVTIQVEGRDGGRVEGDEDFTVELTGCVNCDIDTAQDVATGHIREDDPHVTVDDITVTEGDPARFTVELSEPASSDVDVSVDIEPDTTNAGEDYLTPVPDPQTVTIPAGATTATVDVTTETDDEDEGCETFTATVTVPDDQAAFSPSANADGATGTAVITDAPADAPACVTIDDATVVEGDGPDHARAELTLRADPAPTSEITVDYTTADGTASGDLDYRPASGQVTFAPGDTVQTVSLDVYADLIDEPSEIFTVDLSLPDSQEGASLPTEATATVTIFDDDVPVATPGAMAVVVDNAATVEGDADELSTATFDVRLLDDDGNPTTGIQPVTITYETRDDTAQDGYGLTGNPDPDEDNGTGGDYQPVTDGSLVMPTDASRTSIDVSVIGDDKYEADETFEVSNLQVAEAGRQNVSLAGDQEDETANVAVGTIENDDPVPTVTVSDIAQEEGDAFPIEFGFTVELSNPTYEQLTFDYTTVDGTAVAVPDDPEAGDYQAETQNDAQDDENIIPAGKTGTTIIVLGNGDHVEEPDETFFLDVNPAEETGAIIVDDGRGQATIVNDDGPELAITENVSMLEGDDGTTPLTFDVTLSEARTDGKDVTVDAATSDGTASETVDYEPKSTTVTIPAGETTTTVAVTVNGDTDIEDDETFTVTLSNPNNAVIRPGDGQGTGTILDDDDDGDGSGDPTASIAGPDAGAEGAQLTFDGSASSDPDGKIVEYAWAFSDGSPSARGETITHAFPDDGTYTVALRVTDDSDAIDIAEWQVTVTNADPTATADGDRTIEVFDTATFTGGGSDPGNDTLSFAWRFSDGTEPVAGQTATHVFTETGSHEVALDVTDDDGGVGTDTLTVEVRPDSGDVVRDAGANRVATAVAVSKTNWDSANDAVLATAGNYPDALAGGPLAANLDAPLLLTPTDELHADVGAELERLDVQRIWILGGPAAISQTVEDQLTGTGYDVHRFEGPDRFVTAAVIAAGLGPSPDGAVSITLGTDWADALSAGALAATPDHLPTLLTAPDHVPVPTVQALEFMGASKIYLLGGTAAIAPAVEDQLVQAGYQVERLSGANRYSTSVAVASQALERRGADPFTVPVVFATGQDFPDGLAAAALAARIDGIVLLVPGTGDLRDVPELDSFLAEHAHGLDLGRVVGGTAVVTEQLRSQLTEAVTAPERD